jgi:hypothetical protein
MRIWLRRWQFIAALIVASALAADAGRAQESFFNERFCTRSTGSELSGPMDCSFWTWKQCIESARGLGRFCLENPSWRGPRQEPKTQGTSPRRIR